MLAVCIIIAESIVIAQVYRNNRFDGVLAGEYIGPLADTINL